MQSSRIGDSPRQNRIILNRIVQLVEGVSVGWLQERS